MYTFHTSTLPVAIPVLQEVQLKPWFAKNSLHKGMELLREDRLRGFYCLRNAVGAVFDKSDPVILQFGKHSRLHQGFVIYNGQCSVCRNQSGRDGCEHLAALAILSLVAPEDTDKAKPLPLAFAGSTWEKLGYFLYDRMEKSGYKACWSAAETPFRWVATRQHGPLTATIPAAWQEQAAAVLPGRDPILQNESLIEPFKLLLQRLQTITTTDGEQALRDAGSASIGWTRDNSCWIWLARMLFCIHGEKLPAFRHLPGTSLFELSLTPVDNLGELSFTITGEEAWHLIRQFSFDSADAAVLPTGRECFRAGLGEANNLEITPLVRLDDGRLLSKLDLAPTKFAGGYYLPGEGFLPVERLPRDGIFSEPERESALPLLGFLSDEADRNTPMSIPFEKMHAFLEYNQSALHHPENMIASEILNIEIHPLPDCLVIDDFAEHDGWCYLSCRYGLGSTSIRLEDILAAHRDGLTWLPADGWLQIENTPLSWLHDRVQNRLSEDGSDRIRLRHHEVLALSSIIGTVEVADKKQLFREKIAALLDKTSLTDTIALPDCPDHLRDYQRNGLAWLFRLRSMGIGGLLADDMGLGKTHQALALLRAAQNDDPKADFLVICPASVLLGWAEKIDRYYPELRYTIYYGTGRDGTNIGGGDLILTTYGIVRQDLDILRERNFEVIIADEIQHVKNRSTATHKAVAALVGRMVVGLTGTPIENSLADLHALFDICLPGLLDSERRFKESYIQPLDKDGGTEAGEMLARLVKPFILRRTRRQVLAELPEIIDDNRLCELSDSQVALYRQVIDEREGVIESLQDESTAIPYMNILAMITRLKQICNHPCLIEGSTDYHRFSSGKWDLFVELVDELTDAGMKFVVFSQYTEMLAIIERYLQETGIDFCSLKGSMPTTTRQRMISRFNEDASCRVFVASLLAGGVGIDLTAAQAVIHYDRWWNPAREEQATARVHRMGQKHVVQSFKLTTLGTLEEKIHRLINRKKELVETVIKEDEANIIKRLDRSELAALFHFAPGTLTEASHQ